MWGNMDNRKIWIRKTLEAAEMWNVEDDDKDGTDTDEDKWSNAGRGERTKSSSEAKIKLIGDTTISSLTYLNEREKDSGGLPR